ncbi:hypothetical protein HK103_000931 [Boothiomyces macroporosus]|uniref:Uncharacterized protein n=1 Tax=Boothiomyces macroporosus TaxID=261099 RepID=A0AAD5UNM6_9FUNG|nr:hypothetical protein HK103_000931 [Boothiomyces macroporosus]
MKETDLTVFIKDMPGKTKKGKKLILSLVRKFSKTHKDVHSGITISDPITNTPFEKRQLQLKTSQYSLGSSFKDGRTLNHQISQGTFLSYDEDLLQWATDREDTDSEFADESASPNRRWVVGEEDFNIDYDGTTTEVMRDIQRDTDSLYSRYSTIMHGVPQSEVGVQENSDSFRTSKAAIEEWQRTFSNIEKNRRPLSTLKITTRNSNLPFEFNTLSSASFLVSPQAETIISFMETEEIDNIEILEEVSEDIEECQQPKDVTLDEITVDDAKPLLSSIINLISEQYKPNGESQFCPVCLGIQNGDCHLPERPKRSPKRIPVALTII